MTGALLKKRLRLAAASALAIVVSHGMAWANGAEQDADTGVVVPWRLIAGFGLIAAALVGSMRRRHVADIAIAVGLAAGAYAIRASLFPFSYCHPNGQGPLWIEYALGQPSNYGTGYHEVFGLWVQDSSTPGRSLVRAQGALASLVPALVYGVFRAMGTGRLIAAAAGIGCVFEPVLARLSRCESYLRVALSLVAIATSALALTAAPWVATGRASAPSAGDREKPPSPLRDPRLTTISGIVGAGLVIAQLARIHPGSWLAAAVAPLAILALPGAWRRRVAATLVAGVGVAVVVAVTTLGPMVEVLTGGLGSQWMPAVNSSSYRIPFAGLFITLALVAVFGTAGSAQLRRVRSAAASALDVAALVAIVAFTHFVERSVRLFEGTPYHIHEGNRLLYAWVAVFAVAGVIGRTVPTRSGPRLAVAVGLAVLMAADFATEWEDARYQPTDAREALFVRSWRAELPRDARVHYVERAGEYVFRMPIYAPATTAHRHTIRPGELGRRRVEFEPGHYWYRSSLCSTTPARSLCETVEAGLVLETVYETTLPALPTMDGFDYTTDEVRVGLYRITAIHEAHRAPAQPAPRHKRDGTGTGRPL